MLLLGHCISLLIFSVRFSASFLYNIVNTYYLASFVGASSYSLYFELRTPNGGSVSVSVLVSGFVFLPDQWTWTWTWTCRHLPKLTDQRRGIAVQWPKEMVMRVSTDDSALRLGQNGPSPATQSLSQWVQQSPSPCEDLWEVYKWVSGSVHSSTLRKRGKFMIDLRIFQFYLSFIFSS